MIQSLRFTSQGILLELDRQIDDLAWKRYGISGAEFRKVMAQEERIRECTHAGGRGWLPALLDILADDLD